ncbi:dihydroxyacetone kinase subunit L [Ramlibacter ginsenosidimutans]|uniref:Dihydroxyacetone kinase subunit L n=1 Tax=Ramlibacter ginsenosidimutans TaxID=502333 RepID=A0A934TV25_9BURK|nr:DAK2 domain-containing protein [Ramlibacter ginsenosidimutans]MBK6007948.1 dihydroxyacetone kinase subunit L [Ramlibacter ginsenosidimutans]
MIDAGNVRSALARWCDALEAAAPELNGLDGRLGDGDLGTTLQRCAVLVREALPAMGDDLASVFKACAGASAKASGSSFGTLLAVAFLTAAKRVQGRDTLDRAALVELLDDVVGALSARGGAALGDKTMLDSLHAIARALAESNDNTDLRCVAREAASGALEAMRSKPNRIGRARMFAERSIGLEDPGMVAVLRMAEAL